MAAQSPELQARIAAWRAKQAAGELTQEDMREIILHLRGDRAMVAQATSGTKSASRKKAAPTGKSSGDLLDELEGM